MQNAVAYLEQKKTTGEISADATLGEIRSILIRELNEMVETADPMGQPRYFSVLEALYLIDVLKEEGKNPTDKFSDILPSLHERIARI